MSAYQNRYIGLIANIVQSQLLRDSDTRVGRPANGPFINSIGIDAASLAHIWAPPPANIRSNITTRHFLFSTLGPQRQNTIASRSTLQFFQRRQV